LTPPVGKYEIITDAAGCLIEVVKEKGGNIEIIENGDGRIWPYRNAVAI
jgi:hypothetical protein